MHRNTLFIILLCAAGIAAPAAADMKPGLWEMTITSDAMKNMPKLPPEQVEQMRKMGASVPMNGVMTTKICVTKAMAERDPSSMSTAESGCAMKNWQRSANAYSADMVCDRPEMKAQGKVKGSMPNNESFISTSE